MSIPPGPSSGSELGLSSKKTPSGLRTQSQCLLSWRLLVHQATGVLPGTADLPPPHPRQGKMTWCGQKGPSLQSGGCTPPRATRERQGLGRAPGVALLWAGTEEWSVGVRTEESQRENGRSSEAVRAAAAGARPWSGAPSRRGPWGWRCGSKSRWAGPVGARCGSRARPAARGAPGTSWCSAAGAPNSACQCSPAATCSSAGTQGHACRLRNPLPVTLSAAVPTCVHLRVCPWPRQGASQCIENRSGAVTASAQTPRNVTSGVETDSRRGHPSWRRG